MRNASAEEIAYDYLKKRGGSAPVSEVIDFVVKEKQFLGKTPRKSVSSVLYKSRRIRKKSRYCEII